MVYPYAVLYNSEHDFPKLRTPRSIWGSSKRSLPSHNFSKRNNVPIFAYCFTRGAVLPEVGLKLRHHKSENVPKLHYYNRNPPSEPFPPSPKNVSN